MNNRAAMNIDFDPPEIRSELPCQDCGCRSMFAVVAPAGKRHNPVYLRCNQCGRERQDLKDFSGVSCGTESTARDRAGGVYPAQPVNTV